MRSRENPFQPLPTTIGEATSRVVTCMVIVLLSRKLAVVLGLEFEAAIFILSVAMASPTLAASLRRRNRLDCVFIGVAYLWVGALLGLLYALKLALRDGWMPPYAVVLFFMVIGLGTLVVSLRQSFYPAADDIKKKPSHPLADEVI